MSISNIVCRSGVGPTSTIGLFVTHGLLPGNAPPPVVTEQNTAGFPVYGYGISSIDHAQAEYDARLRKKQEELLEKQIEAQDLRLRQIELKNAETKQNKRQLAALDKEYLQLMEAIKLENILLNQLQKEYSLKFRNQQALLVLSMALPFFNVEDLTMH